MFYEGGMRLTLICFRWFLIVVGFSAALLPSTPAWAAENSTAEFNKRFFQLCELTAPQVQNGTRKGANFIDSYEVRALCVAYDVTGNKQYLDACRAWAKRMAVAQEGMIPKGAYYMGYHRKPGDSTNAWYVADCASIAMGVLATAVRCDGAEKHRLIESTKAFAALVMDNYVGPGGGIRNGLWPKFDGEWWCSSGIFGSLAFLLYNETGDERYLKTALGVVDWLNQLDAEADSNYPLSEMGPTYPMYVLEAYSAGMPHLKHGTDRRQAAVAKVSWYLDWIAKQQAQPPRARQWPAHVRWGMKFGGLPFHQYMLSGHLRDGHKLRAAADREMESLAPLVFTDKPELTQLPAFMIISYAERLSPGAIYKSSKRNSDGARQGSR